MLIYYRNIKDNYYTHKTTHIHGKPVVGHVKISNMETSFHKSDRDINEHNRFAAFRHDDKIFQILIKDY